MATATELSAVGPALKANLTERRKKIAEGLAAADKGKSDLAQHIAQYVHHKIRRLISKAELIMVLRCSSYVVL